MTTITLAGYFFHSVSSSIEDTVTETGVSPKLTVTEIDRNFTETWGKRSVGCLDDRRRAGMHLTQVFLVDAEQ